MGICGVSGKKKENQYGIKLPSYREILYLVVDKNFQRKGIGTKLLQLCTENVTDKIIYEAWGDGEFVNSKVILERCGFNLYKNLGSTYYKEKGYCPYCVNRNKNCNSCLAEIWIKN